MADLHHTQSASTQPWKLTAAARMYEVQAPAAMHHKHVLMRQQQRSQAPGKRPHLPDAIGQL